MEITQGTFKFRVGDIEIPTTILGDEGDLPSGYRHLYAPVWFVNRTDSLWCLKDSIVHGPNDDERMKPPSPIYSKAPHTRNLYQLNYGAKFRD